MGDADASMSRSQPKGEARVARSRSAPWSTRPGPKSGSRSSRSTRRVRARCSSGWWRAASAIRISGRSTTGTGEHRSRCCSATREPASSRRSATGSRRPRSAIPSCWPGRCPCGTCGPCRRGVPRRCSHAWTQPPRVRRARDAAPLAGTLSLGTLATHTVVHAAQAIPMPPELPLRSGCLLGCGVSTGVGAATQTAKVWPGARVAVIGLGGIGLAALQGAKIAGRRAADRRGHRGAEAGLGEAVRGDRHGRRIGRRRRRGGSRAHAGATASTSRSKRPASLRWCPRRWRCSTTPESPSRSACRRSPPRSPWRGTAPSMPPTHGRRRCSSPTAAIRSRRRTSPRWPDGRSTGASTSTAWSAGSSASIDLDEAFRAMLAGEVIRSVVVFDAVTRALGDERALRGDLNVVVAVRHPARASDRARAVPGPRDGYPPRPARRAGDPRVRAHQRARRAVPRGRGRMATSTYGAFPRRRRGVRCPRDAAGSSAATARSPSAADRSDAGALDEAIATIRRGAVAAIAPEGAVNPDARRAPAHPKRDRAHRPSDRRAGDPGRDLGHPPALVEVRPALGTPVRPRLGFAFGEPIESERRRLTPRRCRPSSSWSEKRWSDSSRRLGCSRAIRGPIRSRASRVPTHNDGGRSR